MMKDIELANILQNKNPNKEFSLEKIAYYKDWFMLRLD